MPFTISHAAAVLPLRRLGAASLPLPALMIGSMSPDFAYFLPVEPGTLATHTIAALFWFCLPLGFSLWLLYTRVLERPTLLLIPVTWRSRLEFPSREMSVKSALVAALAILIGASTHLAWDAFTHAGTPVTAALPLLRTRIGEWQDAPLRVYWLLQHLSSLAGLLILAIWSVKLLRPPSDATRLPSPEFPDPITDRARLAALAFMALSALALAAWGFLSHPELNFERRLYHFAIGGMTGAALSWYFVAMWVRRRHQVLRDSGAGAAEGLSPRSRPART